MIIKERNKNKYKWPKFTSTKEENIPSSNFKNTSHNIFSARDRFNIKDHVYFQNNRKNIYIGNYESKENDWILILCLEI